MAVAGFGAVAVNEPSEVPHRIGAKAVTIAFSEAAMSEGGVVPLHMIAT